MKERAKAGLMAGLMVLAGLSGASMAACVMEDNFDRADGSALGTASDGRYTWNQSCEDRVGFQIVNNQLVSYVKDTGAATWQGGIAVNDLNVADGAVRIHVTGSIGHDSSNGIALGYRAENAAAFKTVTAPGAFHLYLIPHDAGADEDWAYIMLFAGGTNLGLQWAHIGDLNDDFWLEASFNGDQHKAVIYEADGVTEHGSWNWTSDYRSDGMVGFTSNWIHTSFDDFQVVPEPVSLVLLGLGGLLLRRRCC